MTSRDDTAIDGMRIPIVFTGIDEGQLVVDERLTGGDGAVVADAVTVTGTSSVAVTCSTMRGGVDAGWAVVVETTASGEVRAISGTEGAAALTPRISAAATIAPKIREALHPSTFGNFIGQKCRPPRKMRTPRFQPGRPQLTEVSDWQLPSPVTTAPSGTTRTCCGSTTSV